MFGVSDEALPPLVEVDGWRAGRLICYDIEFPENPRRPARAGANLIVVPTANMTAYDFVAKTLLACAFENQLCLTCTNYCGIAQSGTPSHRGSREREVGLR